MICTAWWQLDFSCIHLWMIFYLDVCCCCNLMMFYDWSECVMSVLGTTKHSLCDCIDTWQKSCNVLSTVLGYLRMRRLKEKVNHPCEYKTGVMTVRYWRRNMFLPAKITRRRTKKIRVDCHKIRKKKRGRKKDNNKKERKKRKGENKPTSNKLVIGSLGLAKLRHLSATHDWLTCAR